MEADVSQCELRVLAHFSQDPRLLAAYRDANVDLHVRTAAAALGIAAEQVTDEQRGIGKQVNFAIIYGMAADGWPESWRSRLSRRRRCWTAISLPIRQYEAGLPRSMRRHSKIAKSAH